MGRKNSAAAKPQAGKNGGSLRSKAAIKRRKAKSRAKSKDKKLHSVGAHTIALLPLALPSPPGVRTHARIPFHSVLLSGRPCGRGLARAGVAGAQSIGEEEAREPAGQAVLLTMLLG